jgi:hypothetical protein
LHKHLAFIILLFPIVSIGASWSNLPKGTLSTKFGIARPTLGLNVNSNLNNEPKPTNISYEPNNTGYTYLSLAAGSFAVSLSNQAPNTEESIAKFGKSEGADYQFRLFAPKRTWDFFYQKYSGYYLTNSKELFGTENIIQVPSLTTEHMGVQMIWNFQPGDVHLGASLDQGAIQKESAFSWLGVMSLHQNNVVIDQSLIPAGITDSFGIDKFRKGSFSTLRYGGGGVGTLVVKRVYLSTSFLITGGNQQQKLFYSGSTYPSDQLTRLVTTNGVNLRLGIGYNGDEHYAGMTFINEGNNLVVEQANLTSNTMYVSFFYGMRWDTPGLAFLEIF